MKNICTISSQPSDFFALKLPLLCSGLSGTKVYYLWSFEPEEDSERVAVMVNGRVVDYVPFLNNINET